VDEVINYVNAMNYGLQRLAELPVSVRLIREIHERLLAGVRGSERQPGELRKTQNWIGPGGAALTGATFVPPPPDEVPVALSSFERFIHEEDAFPALVIIGLAHAQFETIHPFLDGNGRVGRLLIAFLLCEREILQKPVLYLSHYFRRHRPRYYDLLQAIRDDGDWEAWIKFFLAGISDVAREATKTARRIVSLRELHRRLVTEEFGRATASGLRVLEALYSFPIVTVNNVVKITGSSFTAANQLIRKFEATGILTESTGRVRNRRFRYDRYIELFSD
jgi:Fic family protein